MGILIGIIIGVIAYRCITLFIAAGKCDAAEGCCKTKRWLFLLPLIIIVLLGVGVILLSPGFAPWHMGHGGYGMPRPCW